MKIQTLPSAILTSNLPNKKALCNLFLALSSNTNASSVTELSLSPTYHYQYSSITDAVSSLSKFEEFMVGEDYIGFLVKRKK